MLSSANIGKAAAAAYRTDPNTVTALFP